MENYEDNDDVFPVPPKRVKIFETGTRRPVSDAVEVGFLKAFNQRHRRHSILCIGKRSNKISIYFNNMHSSKIVKIDLDRDFFLIFPSLGFVSSIYFLFLFLFQ